MATRWSENMRMLGKLTVIIVGMFSFGYAMIPLYKHICEVTGINILAFGETQVPGASSKAAANMVVKTAACEFGAQGATVVALHPGWVRTDMGGPKADLGVTESVENLRDLIAGLSADCNGEFFDYTGRQLPW